MNVKKRLQTVLVPYWGEINADGTISYGYERRFELIEEEEEMKKFTKSDLREGDIVQYRGGDLRIVKGGSLYNGSTFMNTLDNYDQNLKIPKSDYLDSDYLDIVKVYRSIWKREDMTIASNERVLLENVEKNYRYIARNHDSTLFLFGDKPTKEKWMWVRTLDSYASSFAIYSHLFPMVKWEDEEPWLIEDLLKLPVKENE